MTGRFAGQVAVVTGGAAGIGRAVSDRLASEGASVAVLDRDEAGAQQVAEKASAAGGVATAVPVDVTDWPAVHAAFEEVDHCLGRASVLVNCAGGSSPADALVDRLDPALVMATYERDVGGTMACSQAAIPRMQCLGGGAIVNLTSYVALDGTSHTHAYVAAKGAVISLTRAMAGSYARYSIRVNAVAPGIVMTDRVRDRIEADRVDLETIERDYPGAVAGPEQTAAVIAFLASRDATTVTGAVVAADGGLSTF